MYRQKFIPLFLSVLTYASVQSQDHSTSSTTFKGPVLEDYGPYYPIAEPDLTVTPDETMKVVFDITGISEDAKDRNRIIESAARFLNLHAANGLPVSHMKVALVIHGSASRDILKDDIYKERYGMENPNSGLLKALKEAGVDIYLCGQTAASRGIDREDVLPEVKMALSAMTALVKLQNQEYRLISF